MMRIGDLTLPLTIWACSRFFGRQRAIVIFADQELRSVTVLVLIAARDEERWMRARIKNALEQHYPREKLILAQLNAVR
jgi:hypothetical protein